MPVRWMIALCLFVAGPVYADDACRAWGISAAADVDVSDGSRFQVETAFHGPRSSAYIRPDTDTTIAFEGAQSWARQGDKVQLATEFHSLFALGHQYHAFVLYFDELLSDVRPSEISLNGRPTRGRTGTYPFGGLVHEVTTVTGDPDKNVESRMLRFDFPERGPIWARLSDWRPAGAHDLPYRIEIDDGERTFDYRYTRIDVEAGDARWFHAQVPAPNLDPIQVHRLHREMLVAHCAGDADALAGVTLPGALSVNGGEVTRIEPDDMATRFRGLFSRLDYRQYIDLIPPAIQVADSADLAWAAVQVRAVGGVVNSDQTFDDQWAWVMLARKVNGVWMHAGNASNRKPG